MEAVHLQPLAQAAVLARALLTMVALRSCWRWRPSRPAAAAWSGPKRGGDAAQLAAAAVVGLEVALDVVEQASICPAR